MIKRISFAIIPIFLLLAACQPAAAPLPQADDPAVMIEQMPLERNRVCNGGFFPHYLDHVTTNAYEPIDMYDSNGAGVAVNDLDQDGDLDIVMANLADNNQIFWNKGNYQFSSVAFPHGSSRAAATVDVNGDGLLDIVFTSRVGNSLLYWRNTGDFATDFPFEQEPLQGVQEYAYVMNWGDLDLDGDLDLVTGSYDTSLDKELRDTFMMGDGAGVFVFENVGDRFETQARLTETSQALAVALMDLNADGRKDILVGNDFDSMKDQYWLAEEDGWEQIEPFEATTQNTMIFDMGDINNDGQVELFAADMHQYAFDEETNAAWGPVMDMMQITDLPDNRQIMENVLQVPNGDGTFSNIAQDSGIAYSGWSWSSRFGDLNQDGFLDLYIVNGMATFETFGHLPNNELVEENQAFRNNGSGQFLPAPEWNLGATEGGRGMTMADLDGDGDLDIVINNLLAKGVIFENRICQGQSLLVDLKISEDEIQNRFAIGSRLILETTNGPQVREIEAVAGYLSAPPTQVHFGLPNGSQILSLTIEWVDGQSTVIDQLTPNHHLLITR
ncbi:MAG: CRTAC1 family protein [Chloroflexota bacterium]